jgi:GH24 family phage-related lysozyme (muramidase)
MNVEEVYETLKIDEGVKYEIYADHLGYHTFGVGHLVINEDPEWGQPFGTPISEERVWECFEKDLDTAITECHALYTESVFDDFPEEVQQIVVNMMFNMGRTRLSKFKKFTGASDQSRRTPDEKIRGCLINHCYKYRIINPMSILQWPPKRNTQ